MKRRLIFLAFAPSLIASAAPAATSEVQVKATYLFKLAAFVRWPAPTPDDFRICITGRSDIASALGTLTHDQQVEGRKIAVVELAADQAQNASACRVLFLGHGPETAQAMLKAAAGNPVLTVTDRDGGTHGGVVEFRGEGGKVRLAVDRSEAASHMLELSSKLMDVAAEVSP